MLESLTPQALFYALLGGVLPALLWLWFWLKEDKKRPEPRGLIMLAFFAGMASVILVYPLEMIVANFVAEGPMRLALWAAIEESVKFGTIILVITGSRHFDEPIDAMIYMITVALGFAALENTLFLIQPITSGQPLVSFLTGNLRFLGATLLHVIASASVGAMIAFAFFNPVGKKIMGLLGLCIATALHTAFNFFIMKENGPDPFSIFLWLWVGAIFIIFLFEGIKQRSYQLLES
jgi:RsiW-degrading membrane proteinase PrsW (M82 family)